MKKHNGIISFWKFMFSILILIFHCSVWSDKNNILFTDGRIGVEFFFIVSGYLMAKKALNNKDNLDNIGKETFTYIWKKIKNFFPYILVAFVISLFVNKINKKEQIINSIWNLCFLGMAGFKSTDVIGVTWYISAMLISMLILYPLIRKYKEKFTYIIAPLIVIFISGWMSHKYGKIEGPSVWTGLVYKGLLRSFFELTLGVILYEIVERLKNINFTKLSQYIFTIIEISGFILIFILSNKKNASKYDFIMILIMSISISFAFSEKTIFYNFANNKLFYYLEKLSLPIYLNHKWIITLVGRYLSHLNYYTKIGITLVITIIFSMIIMFVIEKIQKLFNEKKHVLKKVFVLDET